LTLKSAQFLIDAKTKAATAVASTLVEWCSMMSIIVVKLTSIEAKTRITKNKRISNDQRKIFFDDRLTNFNRALFTAARKVAKESEKKAFVNHGRVFIGNGSDKSRITTFNDIEKFKQLSSTPMKTVKEIPSNYSADI
jgi:hypothetical protein